MHRAFAAALAFAVLLGPLAYGKEKISSVPAKETAPVEPELKYNSAKVWLAPPAAFFLGFGIGHAVQDRLSGYALIYPVADVLGYLFIISGMGSCANPDRCRSGKDRVQKTGLWLLVASRTAQVIDTSIWSFHYYQSSRPQVTLLPTKGGLEILGSVSF